MFSDCFKGKRVLVSGHTGFKGSWLSQWLLELGAHVAGLSIDIPTEPSHFNALGLDKRLEDHRADINDLAAVQNIFKKVQPEIVFHLAAQPIVSKSIQDPVANFMTNLGGTVHVLEAVRKTDSVRSAVFITSDKCYENREWEFGYRETDQLGGKDPYSASKACAEIAFHSYFRTYFADQAHLRVATARAGNVIGGGDWAKDRIVPDNVKAWGAGTVPVIRSPKATRPWQHVLEPLSGYLLLAAQLQNRTTGINGESFNFGPPANVNATVEDLLREMAKHWPGCAWRVEGSQLERKEAGLLKLNCDKALARLSWQPTMHFQETIEFTAEWYKRFYKESPKAAASLTSQQIKKYAALATERGSAWTK